MAVWVSFLVLAFAFCARAEEIKCFICGATIHGKYYTSVDRVTGITEAVCTNCSALPDRCAECGLPVKDAKTVLPDGRVLCAREAAQAVSTEQEGREICAGVADDLNHLFSRWMDFPTTNALISIGNRFSLENLMHVPGETKPTVDILGATTCNRLHDGRFIHNIVILSHLDKAELMSVCAHELTHAWMGQNHILEHRATPISKDMVEGMCELIAHKYMESRGATVEMGRIERNNYTRGKIMVLLAVDKQYGLNAIIEWMAHGEDAALELNNIDRVRALEGHPVTSPETLAELIYAPGPAVAVSAPTNLLLKSVSGTGNRRFAMINSTTFELMEKAKVRVGQTNLTVRCLEIKDNSVTVEVEGQSGQRQLLLGASN
jgi:hypothetical protein